MRAIVTIAVPVATVLFGLLWYFGRKQSKPSKQDQKPKGSLSTTNNRSEVSNGSAGKTPATSELQQSPQKSSNNVEKLKPSQTAAVSEKGDASDKREDSIPKSVVQPSSSEPSKAPIVEEQISAVKEEIVESVVQQSFSKPTNSKPVAKSNSSSENSESVIPSDIIAQIQVNKLETSPTTASHDSEQANVESTNNVSAENSSNNVSQVINEQVVDSKDKSSELENGVNEVTGTDSVLEKSAEPMSRSWYEDIPDDNDVPDLQNLSASDTSGNSPRKSVDNDVNNSDLQKNNTSLDSGKSVGKESSLNSSSQQPDKTSDTNTDSSSNCDSLSEASNDSGKGGSVHENLNQSPPDEHEERIFEFNIPSDICGLFIGRSGKTIKMISQQSGTKIRLQNNPYTPNYQICVLEGDQKSIDCACRIIKRKFPAIRFPGPEVTPGGSTMIMPEIMQMSLPEGVSVDVVVSSIVDAGRIFVQQPTHPSYTSLERLNTFMNQCYMSGTVPDIPRPIETGVICAAPMLNGWYRAQIMATQDDVDECDIKYVDYGGYSRVCSSLLKQIRSDFMTLPFEAVECYMANITHLEYEQFFSPESAVVLEELTQGKMLQARVVGHADDGIPFVEIYQVLGTHPPFLVNREMVNRGVVRWVEQLDS